jgi:hypothetical protein
MVPHISFTEILQIVAASVGAGVIIGAWAWNKVLIKRGKL